MRTLLLTLSLALVTPFLLQTEIPPTATPAGPTPIFEDTFDTEGLDPTKWEQRYPTGHEYGAGFAHDASIQQPGDGLLHLVTLAQEDLLFTGMVKSVPEFTYGCFEASIRFQTLQGHHGAFWLQSPTYGATPDAPGTSGAEIDIIEFFGNGRHEPYTDAQHAVHWNAYNSGQVRGTPVPLFYNATHEAELSEDFHTFGLRWTDEDYTFFVDGEQTWTSSEGISNRSEYLVLHLVTQNWELDRLDRSLLPDELQVDWVRVYEVQTNGMCPWESTVGE